MATITITDKVAKEDWILDKESGLYRVRRVHELNDDSVFDVAVFVKDPSKKNNYYDEGHIALVNAMNVEWNYISGSTNIEIIYKSSKEVNVYLEIDVMFVSKRRETECQIYSLYRLEPKTGIVF